MRCEGIPGAWGPTASQAEEVRGVVAVVLRSGTSSERTGEVVRGRGGGDGQDLLVIFVFSWSFLEIFASRYFLAQGELRRTVLGLLLRQEELIYEVV